MTLPAQSLRTREYIRLTAKAWEKFKKTTRDPACTMAQRSEARAEYWRAADEARTIIDERYAK